MTVECIKPFVHEGQTHRPGKSIVLPRGIAIQMARDGLVKPISDRAAGMRDKMIYPSGIRHGGTTK